MIVMDLEWNRGYDDKPVSEILQIGAVRTEKPGGPILDTFNAYIRPVVHKKADRWAKELPEFSEAQKSNLDFRQAMALFRRWQGADTVFAFWGGGDNSILEENCRYWEIEPPAMEKIYDFQKAFSRRLQAENQIALWRAAEYCGIPDSFTFHNALNDAMYACLIGGWLTADCLEEPLDNLWIPELCQIEFPRQPRQRVGPEAELELLLNAKSSRKPACPLCGQRGTVNRWYEGKRQGEARLFYSLFSCPEHGSFLCRLTVLRLENGSWRGRRAVPALSSELLKEYRSAAKGEPFRCKRFRRRHRRSGEDRQNP